MLKTSVRPLVVILWCLGHNHYDMSRNEKGKVEFLFDETDEVSEIVSKYKRRDEITVDALSLLEEVSRFNETVHELI